MAKVKIQAVQAISFIELNMPENTGGVRIFRGENGAGKSTALLCLAALLGRKTNLSPAEGSPKGVIEGLGVTKTIQKKTTTKGDVDAVSLEGRFDFSDLVDPSVKCPNARNKSRIRALVGLTAKECSLDDFRELFESNEQFDAITGDCAWFDGDPLELADTVKKAAESKARALEASVEDATARWQVAVEQSKGIKPDKAPPPVAELAAKYSAAKNALAAAESQVEANGTAIAHNAKVAELLAKHQDNKPAQSPEDAGEKVKQYRKLVNDLQAKLTAAQTSLAAFEREFDACMDWEERLTEIEMSKLPVVEELPELEPLQAAEQAALVALETSETAKQQYESAVRAKSLSEAITRDKAEAEKYREIAKSTGKVVTKMLPKSCPLQVNEHGILGVHHKGRGHWVEIEELSEGERWEVGMAVAVEAVGEGGILPLKQEAWQSLDKQSRDAIAKQCQDAKVWLVSAEVADGPLRVEEYRM